ncbi:hypothetical protein M422DRAFT_163040 [Sphaerobolus stellatus SS14]|uniref:Fucose-specific lectin n=1 Tax=Sphaerobolus stellatus (strain SS14) TaxID=990650 RepID=A0A0C9VWH4_SPHS4|nr:hypothetical protein M422DRAFT_163040 [Sphaerobolus stellatus SS14]
MQWKYTPLAEGLGYYSDWHVADSPLVWLYEPVSIGTGPNTLAIFTVGNNQDLWQTNFNLQTTADISPWVSLGGRASCPPVVALRKHFVHIFYVGVDHMLYHKMWDGGKYIPANKGEFEKIGGPFLGGPLHSLAAVSATPDTITVFGIGAKDSKLYRYDWTEGKGWGKADVLPGLWADSLKAVTVASPYWDVFGLSIGGGINHVHFNAEDPYEFEEIPGEYIGLEAISSKPHRIDLFPLPSNHTPIHKVWESGKWISETSLGGWALYPLKAVTHTPGSLAVYCIGNSTLYAQVCNRQTGKWSGWVAMGGTMWVNVG